MRNETQQPSYNKACLMDASNESTDEYKSNWMLSQIKIITKSKSKKEKKVTLWGKKHKCVHMYMYNI